MAIAANHSSVSVEWFTPAPLVESARYIMRSIDLDPASCEEANGVVNAASMSTHGGLGYQWNGNVFLNPPGGRAPKGSETRSEALRWWKKLVQEYRVGRVSSAFYVGFNIEQLAFSQGLGEEFSMMRFPFCIPQSRIAFERMEDGVRVAAKSPAHGNVIVGLPPLAGTEAWLLRFATEMMRYGDVRS